MSAFRPHQPSFSVPVATSFRRLLLGAACWWSPLGLLTAEPLTAPIVPGFERWAGHPELFSPAEQGELLLGELYCVGCHEADDDLLRRLDSKPPPDLTRVGARVREAYLVRFLTAPRATKPGLLMPDLLHGLPEELRVAEAEALALFLGSRGGPLYWDRSDALESEITQGKELFETLGCIACHAPESPLESGIASVPLGNLAEKTTVNRLQDFLLHPHRSRPRSRMPRFRLALSQAHALAVYLLREQFPRNDRYRPTPGLIYEYFELDAAEGEPLLEDREPQKTGRQEGAPFRIHRFGFRDADVAYRFRGQLNVKNTGRHTFFLEASGGAVLRIAGREIARTDGTSEASGQADLGTDFHDLELLYWNADRPPLLQVSWRGPGFERQSIPAHALFNRLYRPMRYRIGHGRPRTPGTYEEKIQKGPRIFAERGCAKCHRLDGVRPVGPSAPPLLQLDPSAPGGCLDQKVAEGRPDYHLSEPQRAALSAALRSLPERRPRSAALAAHFTLASRNCLACHERDGVGGPDAARGSYFRSNPPLDIGFEGHIPPRLSGVGGKLRPEALATIIAGADMSREKNLHVRNYFSTVMPSFPLESMPDLVSALVEADRVPDVDPFSAPGDASSKIGAELVGTKRLSCVSCHPIGPVASQGAPGINLVFAHRRLRAPWFARFLAAPARLKPNTRMPAYWTDGNSPLPDLLGGSPWRQMEAIWHYLSQGPSMAAPSGTRSDAEAYELTPTDHVIVLRGLMEGVGPRTILSGFPDGVHFAFDANQVRLARVWRGRFFNASGLWVGRRTRFLAPSSEDVFDLPAGPAIAALAAPDAPWPRGAPGDRALGGEFLGYTLTDTGAPRLRYRQGTIEISEEAEPWMSRDKAGARRRFTLKGTRRTPFSVLLARDRSVTPNGNDTWTTASGVSVELEPTQPGRARVRETSEGTELLLELPPGDETTELEVRLTW